MMTRRSFFSSLAALPVILAKSPASFAFEKAIDLPVGMYLSLAGVQWAILLGAKQNIGKPQSLIVSQEEMFIARDLLHRPSLIPENLNLIVDSSYGPSDWRVKFEHGFVQSVWPWPGVKS